LIIVKVDIARSISQNKRENIFYSKRSKNVEKIRTLCPIRFLRRILKKKRAIKTKNILGKKKRRKKKEEKNFWKAILPVLPASP